MILLLAFSVSCRVQSPSEELKAELQTISSWTATAQMVGESWASDAIPAAYARRTLETAREVLEQEDGRIKELSASTPELSAEVSNRAQELKQSTARMQRAIGQGNRAQVIEEIEKLKAQGQAVRGSLERLNGGTR